MEAKVSRMVWRDRSPSPVPGSIDPTMPGGWGRTEHETPDPASSDWLSMCLSIASDPLIVKQVA
jgi:hypothetical protein